MAGKYDRMSTEDFDRYLVAEVERMTAPQLLAIPGVYEVLSEELNNDVLDAWAAGQEDQED